MVSCIHTYISKFYAIKLLTCSNKEETSVMNTPTCLYSLEYRLYVICIEGIKFEIIFTSCKIIKCINT